MGVRVGAGREHCPQAGIVPWEEGGALPKDEAVMCPQSKCLRLPVLGGALPGGDGLGSEGRGCLDDGH